MTTLDKLEYTREKLEDKLSIVKEKIKLEELRIAKRWHGVYPGAVVISSGKTFVVDEINTERISKNEKPWVFADEHCADGSIIRSVCLYNKWELKK